MNEPPQAGPYVGRPLRRREDFRLLTGKGRYVDDIRVPGMLHLALLRSPHAHAQVTRVDLSAARAATGVRIALSGADLVGKIGPIRPNWVIPGYAWCPHRPVVAVDRVRFVGECVALVVAETREAAYDALDRIDVDYKRCLQWSTRRPPLPRARRNCTRMFRTTSPPITRSAAAIMPKPRFAGQTRCCGFAS